MLIDIDPRDARPPYVQIVEQVRHAAASGRLRPGEPLPSIRQLAERLRVNRNTVDKAYRELDRQGVIETRRGKGAFAADRPPPMDDELQQQVLTNAADALIVKAHHLRVPGDALIELLTRRLEVFAAQRRVARDQEVAHG
ncbi:MAG: GntR family transcriptional regulator [Acidobacteriota bacterium]